MIVLSVFCKFLLYAALSTLCHCERIYTAKSLGRVGVVLTTAQTIVHNELKRLLQEIPSEWVGNDVGVFSRDTYSEDKTYGAEISVYKSPFCFDYSCGLVNPRTASAANLIDSFDTLIQSVLLYLQKGYDYAFIEAGPYQIKYFWNGKQPGQIREAVVSATTNLIEDEAVAFAKPVWGCAPTAYIFSLSYNAATLKQGESLVSPEKGFILTMQFSCNLMISHNKALVWETRTNNKGSCHLRIVGATLIVESYALREIVWENDHCNSCTMTSVLALQENGHFFVSKDDGTVTWGVFNLFD